MSDITETMTVKNGQAAVKTVTVAGKLSPKTSATDTIALVETSDGKQAALKVYNINGGGGGGASGDYLPLSGGTLTGPINFDLPYSSVLLKFGGSSSGEIKTNPQGYLQLPAFTTVYSRLDVDGNIGGPWNTVTTAYIKKLSCGGNNDAKLIVPDTAGTLARLEDIQNAGGLPDQTDNAGKFLTTDGTTASWSDKPLVNNTEFYESFAVGGTVTSSRAISIGYKTKAHDLGTVSIGQNTEAKGISSTAIGNNVGTNALCAIQLGSTGGARATNSDANTFKVATNTGNFELMDANGKIPLERLTYVTNQIGDISTALTAILGE